MKKSILLTLFVTFTVEFSIAQTAPIAIDGKFDDWTSNLQLVLDSPDSKEDLNLLEMQLANDDNFLYIRIKAQEEFDLTDNLLPQEFLLCIDADTNSKTGEPIRPQFGAELIIHFRDRYVEYFGSSYKKVGFTEINLRSAPTVTSKEFEIAIGRRSVPDGINSLFNSQKIRVLAIDSSSGDLLPDNPQGSEYSFDPKRVTPKPLTEVEKSDSSFIRIVAYNVERDAITNSSKQGHFERIIKTLNPDIIGYSEVYNTSINDIKSLMDTWLPLGTNDGWYVVKKSGSDLITAAKWPIVQEWTSLNRQYPTLIDLPAKYGKDLLFTNAHLNCCANDAARQNQVDEYAAFILDAKKKGGLAELPFGTPFVYGGDLNLVGYEQQLRTLLLGDIQNTGQYGNGGPLDWDNTSLTDENFLQTDIRMNYTWRSDGGSFPPGKLDFLIYSDYALQSEKSFVVQTEVMSPSRLGKYNWLLNSTGTASDHFPVVTDFSLKAPSDVKRLEENKFHLYPNPSVGEFKVELGESGTCVLELRNLNGRTILVQEIDNQNNSVGISELPSGVYLVHITTNSGHNSVQKLLKP